MGIRILGSRDLGNIGISIPGFDIFKFLDVFSPMVYPVGLGAHAE